MTAHRSARQVMMPADYLAGIVILAGGASSRMGTPKATLRLPNGERLLDYHINHAKGLGVPVMVADNGRGFLDRDKHSDNQGSGVIVIADYQPVSSSKPCQTSHKTVRNQGALAAIVAAMQTLTNMASIPDISADNSTDKWLLVISCDSLITAPSLWQHLACAMGRTINHSLPDQAVIGLRDSAHTYPLLGLYHHSLAAALQAYIDRGQRRVMPFITPHLHAVPINPAWQALTNFNTPAAFAHACTAITPL